jgi:hypothetical protein
VARCSKCRENISAHDAKRAKTQKDEQGRIKGMLHLKCWYVIEKHKKMGPNGRHGEPPTPYEMSVKTVNADDLTAEAIARRERAEAALLQAEQARAEIQARMAQGDAQSPNTSLSDLLAAADAEVERVKADKHLADHQAELAADRALEDNRSGFADWRDPTEVEI